MKQTLKRTTLSLLTLCTVLSFGVYMFLPDIVVASTSATNLTAGNDGGVGGSSFATASISPPANTLILATFTTRHASLDPTVPTLTGAGLTWVVATSSNYDNVGSMKRVTVFRALGASPSTGALTFDEGGQSQSDAAWVVDQITGADTTGTNGSGAIVQINSTKDFTGTGTHATTTLAAFSSLTDGAYGACAIGNGTGTFTAGQSLTTTGQSHTPSNLLLAGEFSASNVANVACNTSVAGELGVIGIEIKTSTNHAALAINKSAVYVNKSAVYVN